MFKRLLELGDWLEAATMAVLGTCLFVGLVIVLPVVLAREIFTTHPVLALSRATICFATCGVALRDLYRRQWSVASQFLGGLWVFCVIFVFIRAAW